MTLAMCRNIRVLHHFEPPTTPEEIAAAALQYVRKVSGLHHPKEADQKTFDRAVKEIAAATGKLLGKLPASGEVRTREGEREKAKKRWEKRLERLPVARG